MHKRNTSQPNPVRPFKRFIERKKCDSGVDPVKNLEHFFEGDTFHTMHRNRRTITLREDYTSIPTGQVPYGTTKHTYKLGLGTDGRLDRNSLGFQTLNFPRNPTDNLSSVPPGQDRAFQSFFDRMICQPKYEKNTKSTNPWFPKVPQISSPKNLNSVSYNVISHEPNIHTPAISYTQRLEKNYRRQKGIAEFDDLKRPTALNINVDHVAAMSGADKIFARKDGIFTHLYNSAARFGETKPFKA